MVDELSWKVSAAFALGAAAHYALSSWLQPPAEAKSGVSGSSIGDKRAEDAAQAHEGSSSDESDDGEWEGEDEARWEPHKMVLCVRTDLKMGKGALARLGEASCTLGH
jgi:hypothetical protein